MSTDLYAVSGTSPTAVRQTDRPAKAPQLPVFFPPNSEPVKCDTSQFRTVAHV